MPADSPENKCPKPEICHGCGRPWSEPSEDCVFNYHADPQCPECGETIVGNWFGRKIEVPCGCSPVDSGTGTDEKDIYSLVKAAEKTLEMLDAVGYEDKYHGKGELRAALAPFRASVPSSPHETGQKLPTSEEEFAAALLVSFEQGKVAGRRLAKSRAALNGEGTE